MSGAYPPGCTQAMHDRAFGDEEREPCQTCDGTGTSEDDAYDQSREDADDDIAF